MSAHDVAKIITGLVDDWIATHPRIMDPQSINEGPCSEFADEAATAIEEEFPGLVVAVLNEEDVLGPEGLAMPNYCHSFLRVDGVYHDAEAPDGVADWRRLPFFRRHGHNIVPSNELNAA